MDPPAAGPFVVHKPPPQRLGRNLAGLDRSLVGIPFRALNSDVEHVKVQQQPFFLIRLTALEIARRRLSKNSSNKFKYEIAPGQRRARPTMGPRGDERGPELAWSVSGVPASGPKPGPGPRARHCNLGDPWPLQICVDMRREQEKVKQRAKPVRLKPKPQRLEPVR